MEPRTVSEGDFVVISVNWCAVEPAATPRRARPGATLAAELAQTAEGRELLAQGRRELAETLASDGLVALAALRLSKGMSQAALATTSGILQPQLSRLESGLHEDILVSTLERLAQALGEPLQVVNDAVHASRRARAQGSRNV
jgi:DNA-binding Xre family transcriptional regulator